MQTHIAGYQVDEVLALGGTSAVYLVHNPTLPRREALKLLTPHPQHYAQMRAQFLHEVNITAGLEHPTSCASSTAAKPTMTSSG